MNPPSSAPPPRGRLLIFDLDGTLIDSVGDLTTAVNRLRQDHRLPSLSADIVRRHVGDGARKLVERILQGCDVDLEMALHDYRGYYEQHMSDTTTLYPDVREGLGRLRATGYQLAVISNKPAAFCRELLARLGVADCFICILGDGDTPRLKPDPAPLIEVMRRASATPEETWMIGDHHTDLEAARRAGLRSVFVAYGLGEAGLENPAQRCANFMEVVRFFTA